MRKKRERCKASRLRSRSPTPATTIPGWQAKSTEAECGPLHMHEHGLKRVMGSGARQGRGG